MITHDEARKIAQRFIDGHFKNEGKEHPRISIPCDTKRDDDCLLLAYIDQCEQDAKQLKLTQEILATAISRLEALEEEYL